MKLGELYEQIMEVGQGEIRHSPQVLFLNFRRSCGIKLSLSTCIRCSSYPQDVWLNSSLMNMMLQISCYIGHTKDRRYQI